MVRLRAPKAAPLDSFLHSSSGSVFVSNYSTFNSLSCLNSHFLTNELTTNRRSHINKTFRFKNFKRNIHLSRISLKPLESLRPDQSGGSSTYFPLSSDNVVTDSSLLVDKINIPVLSRELDRIPALSLSNAKLEIVKSVFINNAENISLWLRTSKHLYLKELDESVVQLIKDAEKFASIHGLLLGDVSVDDLKSHVSGAKSISDLFSPQFIRKQKKKLYKDNELPLLADPHLREELNVDQEVLSHKRQQLIEKLSFSQALETAKEEASSLLDFKSPSELSSLSRTCTQWIQDISQFIKKDRERGGKFVIPLEMEEELLATTTVKIVLQSMCFPSYSNDHKGNKGGLMKKKIQQTTSNQILISHLAIKLGDEIGKLYNEREQENKMEVEKKENKDEDGYPENKNKNKEIALEKDEEVIEIKCSNNEESKRDNQVVLKTNPKAVLEPMEGEANKYKNWNTSQSAAVGGYLLNALIKSCKIELDLQTALKQYIANYPSYFSNTNTNTKSKSKLTLNSSNKEEVKGGSENERKQNKDQEREDKEIILNIKRNQEKEDKILTVNKNLVKAERDPKMEMIMRFLGVIKKSRFNESLVEVEAFRHTMVRQGLKTFGVLEMRESCMLQLRDFVAKSLVSLAALPMVSRPRKWTNVTTGGSLLLRHNFIRGSKLNEVKVYDLEEVFETVNKFNQVPWVINREMLKIIKNITTTNKDVQVRQLLPVPEKSKYLESLIRSTSVNGFRSSDSETIKEMGITSNELSELSLFMRRIKIAESFENEIKLYMPLNIDFRGRMYPLSPYLNHMNDDLCRSLLLFKEKRKLGERGLFWLKIHISNMYGNDKISFKERIKWVDEHMSIIKDLVKNPYGDFGQNFWVKADKPFQFFSSSRELVQAMEKKEPTEYETNLPIQQDGTCNGLQHYAALGLDELGARYVNLVDAEEPQDLYTHILQLVIQKVYQDLYTPPSGFTISLNNNNNNNNSNNNNTKNNNNNHDINANNTNNNNLEGELCLDDGLPGKNPVQRRVKRPVKEERVVSESNRKYAEISVNNNLLSRKVIKQTVMTICYGVTRIGAIDQVHSKLKDIKKIEHLPENEIRGLAGYLANKILSSITTVFSEAMGIKNWLDDISLAHNKYNLPVTWVSPMGLPCEQPYCLSVTKTVRTPLQAINVSKYVNSVDKRRQKLGFPPNFIHSLDASHLMLTAKRVFDSTNSFAAVHDSFWVHPDQVDTMHKHIREEFVRMHQGPILENLHKSVVDKLQIDFRPPPRKGNLDLEKVIESTYFFH